MRKSVLCLVAMGAGLLVLLVKANASESDNASDYAYTNGWVYGSNGGVPTGDFLPWYVTNDIPFSTYFTGSAFSPMDTTLGYDGHVTEPQSWGVTEAAGSHTGISFGRYLATPMGIGDVLSIDEKSLPNGSGSCSQCYDVAVSFITNGLVNVSLFDFGSATNYLISGPLLGPTNVFQDTGIPVSSNGVHIAFMPTGSTTYSLTLTPVGGASKTFTGTVGNAGCNLLYLEVGTGNLAPNVPSVTAYFNSMVLTRAAPLPCETLKFYQVPLNDGSPVIPAGGTITPGSVATRFPGQDEVSTAYYSASSGFYSGQYMADDFVDLQSTPVVHVTWWGSYMTSHYGSGVQQFLIAFESDVASNAPGNALGYSHPGTVLSSQIVNKGQLLPASGTFVEMPVPLGTNGPANPDGNLYQYDAELAVPAPEQSNQVQWIKIVALTSDGEIVWGWHDRDYGIHDPLAATALASGPGETNFNATGSPLWHCEDDAVTGTVQINLSEGTNVTQSSYTPTTYNLATDGTNTSKDLAFALYTPASEPTFQQWQLNYFGCTNCPLAAANADPDGDGMSNTNELLAGTDPTNAASAFRIRSITVRNTNDLNISWSARYCKAYYVQFTSGTNNGSYSTNGFADITSSLTVMPTVGGNVDLTTNYVDVGAATNKPSRYYRVRLVP